MARPSGLGRSVRIGAVLGIPIKVHWTFGLVLLFIGYMSSLHGLSTGATIGLSALVISIFICVILHEYGHAMAARYYGIGTHDIIISLIGGIARLKQIPEKPSQELIVALAGPTVNVVIAVILGLILHFGMQTELIPPSDDFELLAYSGEFPKFLFLTNIALFLFNLIPAFPMDGGRVLRALLAYKLDRVLATKIAMWIARILSTGFILVAIWSGNITWGLIGVFVFLMSGREYDHVRMTQKSKTKIGKIMRTSFTPLAVDWQFEDVYELMRQTGEYNFVIMQSGQIIGALPEAYIRQSQQMDPSPILISDLMTPRIAIISPQTTLGDVFHMMNENGITICAVSQDQNILGVVDRKLINDFLEK